MRILPTVHLRAMEPEDLDMLYSIENDTSLWHLGMTNAPYSRFVLHDYISQATGDIYTDKQVRLMIENEIGETVGMVDLTTFCPKNLRAEVGIVIADNYRCKGYAQATLSVLHRYAQTTLHLHQLYAFIPCDNLSCIHLFQKSSYRQTAILSDWLFDGSAYHDAILMQCIL